MTDLPRSWWRGELAVALVAVAAFSAVVVLLAVYVTRVPSWASMDFRNTAYFPAHAMLHGLNPYDAATYLPHYPTANPFPPFAPLTLVLYAPFALLPLAAATWVWFAITVGLTLVLSWWALRYAGARPRLASVLGVATLVLVSRPGEWNITLGQQTLTLVLAAYAAVLGARTHPRLAALAVALTTCKPQFGVPLAILLAAAGHVGVAAAGLTVSGLVSLAVLVMMPSAEGLGPIGTFLGAFHASTARIGGAATVWWSQIDVPYLLQHVRGTAHGSVDALVSVGFLGIGVALVYWLARRGRPGDGELRLGVTFLTLLLCVYHQIYDALLLVLPFVLAVEGRTKPLWHDAQGTRRAIVALFVVPASNYVVTFSILERLGITGGWWRAATALNAAVLLMAWTLYATMTFRRRAP